MSRLSSLRTFISGFLPTKRQRRNRKRTLIESLESRRLLAADFQLVSDLNEVDNVAREIGQSAILGGILYFNGSTTNGGSGLWRSDGTDLGTSLVSNISFPQDFVVVGSTLYFTADDDVHGRELWRSNGTSSGTVLVKDIALGAADSNPQSLVNANGTLYFSADDGINGRELWKSNGASSGTGMVRNLNTAANADGIPSGGEVVAFSNFVYFAGNTALTGTELYKSDGTSSGTVLVRDVFQPSDLISQQGSFPKQITRVGSQVYFVASSMSGIHADRPTLWVTNGTFSGTQRLFDASGQSEINSVTAIGTGVYFESGGSLHKTHVVNGLILTELVRSGVGTVFEIKSSGNTAFVAAQAANNFGVLWKTDGTSLGTQAIDQFSGAFNVNDNVPRQLLDWNGALYFKVFGDEIWKSTGTAATTIKLLDVAGDFGKILASTSSRIYLSSEDDGLLRSNGTTSGTVRVQAVETFGSGPLNLFALGDTLYFTANDGESGIELWKQKGILPPTQVLDIVPGLGDSSPADLTLFRELVYFTANSSSGRKLWKTDGTAAGTARVEPALRSIADPESLTVAGKSLYFTATSFGNGRELWRIDSRGDAALVKDVRPGTRSSNPESLVAVNNQLYFAADNGVNGRELWTSNGTSAGTRMVTDLLPGPDGSEPKYLTAVDGRVFFSARNATSGYELFSSNGTAAKTLLVKNIHPTSNSFPTRLTNVSGTLYFSAAEPTTGRELWKTDGTDTGTLRVSDIALGPASSLPTEFTNVNGTVFFQATSLSGDVELWKSNGTASTTSLVRNLNTTGSSSPIGLTNVAGYLYFSATNGINGRELWRSDGTSAGTVMLDDFEPGSGSSHPSLITRVQNRVYVAAITKPFGREILVDDLFDQTDGVESYIAEYVRSAAGNSIRILKGSSRSAPVLLATFPTTEELVFRSASGVDSILIKGSSVNDTFHAIKSNPFSTLNGVDVTLNDAKFVLGNFTSLTLAGLEGNDVYRFDTSVDNSAPMTFRISETGIGIDTLNLSELASAATLNLQLTSFQEVTPRLKLQLLSNGSIENIIGSSFNDVLTGNALANVLEGGIGNDTINGGDGNDTLRGGLGDDRYRFGPSASAEEDSITELPNEGIDNVDFGSVNAAVAFGLGIATPQLVHFNRTLTLNAIDTFENVEGGLGNDVLTGNSLNNELNGRSGDDVLSGGRGDDIYVFAAALSTESDEVNELAAEGLDTLSFVMVASNVTLNIGLATPQNAHLNRTLKLNSAVEFENIAGGSGNDILTCNNRNNVLVGNGGNDQLLGLGGRDILIGGLNFDSLNGGNGEDILIAGVTDFNNSFGNLNILMIEWGSVDPIGSRITKLRTGVGPNSIALAAGTSVHDDNGELDELTGDGSLDWFFRDFTDLITDLNGEVIDEL